MLTPHMNEVLTSFRSSMRALQTGAIMALKGKTRGTVLLPTGTGKTRVQVYTVLDALKDMDTGVAVIAAHRLLLCEQLLVELLKKAHEAGFEFDVLTVASDGVDAEDVATIFEDCTDMLKTCRVHRTTAGEDVTKFAAESKAIGRHLLVVGTYQSIDRLSNLVVDVACMDEAHTSTEEDKHANVLAVLPYFKRCFFFTATPVHGCNGRGMDNALVYGPVLYQASPRMAIDTADILPPAVLSINLTDGKPTYTSVIQAGYRALHARVMEYGKGTLGTVLLVSVAGIDELVVMVKSLTFHQWATAAGIKVFGFTSGRGYFVNGTEVNRREAITQLRALSDRDSAIVLHYDILTEGIDLPNISGVLPLRELCVLKFLQTVGRAARLQGDDRRNLYFDPFGTARTVVTPTGDLEIQVDPMGKSLLNKPVCWVIQNPLISENAGRTNQEMVEAIRMAYEVVPEVRGFTEHSTSSTLEEAKSVLNPQTESEKGHAAQYTIEYEAMVYHQRMAPAEDVLKDDKASAEDKEAAALAITKEVGSLLDILEESQQGDHGNE
jgi:superfamily II DNA or RNA helicase